MGIIPFLFLISIVVGLIWMAMHVQEDTLDTRPNNESQSWSESGSQRSSNYTIHSNPVPYIEPEMFPVEQVIPPEITASRYQPEHLEACKTLFDIVEGAGKVPFGYAKEFNIVLEKETHLKYLLWHQGNIIAFGSLITPDACPPPEDGSPPRLDIFTCCFGIVHPDWQGKRLGRVLLAMRVIEAYEREGGIIFLTATDFSKGYFELLGFKFPPDGIHADDNGALHHHGYVRIHETIRDRLKLFLFTNGIKIPEAG